VNVDGRERPAERDSAVYTVAGFLAAAALFTGLFALVWYPGRIGPGAMLVALIAAGIGGPQRRVAAAAVAVTTFCWFLGMVIAVVLERPVF
jgi:hypothetical protein